MDRTDGVEDYPTHFDGVSMLQSVVPRPAIDASMFYLRIAWEFLLLATQ